MTITIGQLEFDKISGPVSFSILIPTNDLILTNNHFMPIIILIGDEHTSRKNICIPTLDNVINIFTPLWLRLIDSLGCDNFKVDYFVEANFPLELLKLKHYLSDEIKYWYYTKSESVMGYIPSYHNECFLNESNKCITSNINYFYADLRLGHSTSTIKDEDEDFINDKVLKLVDNTIYDKSSNKRSRQRKKRIYRKATDDYESMLYRTIQFSLSESRSYNKTHIPLINNKTVFDIINLVYINPYECGKILFDIKDNLIIKKSKLYKVIDKNNLEFYLNLFYNYFEYVVKNDEKLKEVQEDILEGIENYKYDTNIIKTEQYIDYSSSRKSNTKCEDNYNISTYSTIKSNNECKKLYDRIKKYTKATKEVATTLLIPFNDMYFLFKSWRKNIINCISIYNAGDFHCNFLKNFLTDPSINKILKAYNSLYFDKHSEETYNINTDDKYKDDYYDYVNNEQIQNNEIKRCLEFSNVESINLDSIIIDNIMNQKEYITDKNILTNYKDKLNIIKKRIDLLGEEIYKEMLSGRLISKEEIIDKCSNITKSSSIEECLITCGLNVATYNLYPKEYSNKKFSF